MLDTLIQTAVPLASLTSWHVGGSAEYFAQPQSINELQQLIQARPSNQITWLGLGSNVLVRDGGVSGLVIATRGLNKVDQLNETDVYADVGVASAKVARFCQKNHLGSGEFFAGIPGTVGGALAMNAGAFGGETWPVVKNVTIINQVGELLVKMPDDFEIGYRFVKPRFEGFLGFVGATFHFQPKASEMGKSDIRTLLQKRQAAQPIGTFNCGSVFRNPPGDYAARLIEAAGLKGKSLGGAMISEKHANFIINTGKATSKEIETLIAMIQSTVLTKFQIALECEVKILGENT